MNTPQQQAIIRDLSPEYLAQHPPIGAVETLAAITAKCAPKFIEFRQPFARRPDENDDWQECYVCGGDRTTWSTEHQDYLDCGFCPNSEGKLPFLPNQIFLTVWRDSHSVETLATVLDSGEVNTWVSCSQPDFPEGKKVELTEHEKDVARLGLSRATNTTQP